NPPHAHHRADETTGLLPWRGAGLLRVKVSSEFMEQIYIISSIDWKNADGCAIDPSNNVRKDQTCTLTRVIPSPRPLPTNCSCSTFFPSWRKAIASRLR